MSLQVSLAQDMHLQYYHGQTQHGAVMGLTTVFRVQLSWEELLLSKLVHTAWLSLTMQAAVSYIKHATKK